MMSPKRARKHGIHLPEDVLTMILVMVPVDSLMRLSCVCKAWRDLIRNPYFRGKHSDNTIKNKMNGQTLMFFQRSTKEECLLSLSKNNNRLLLSRRGLRLDSHWRVIGSYNGIVCLKESPTRQLHLYNPVTGEDVQLPRRNLGHGSHCFGFGFDASSKDYKVVAVGRDIILGKRHVEIYKLSTNCWSKHCVYLECTDLIFGNGVFVNGSCHWRTSKGRILTFDFETETFGTMKLPHYKGCFECMGVMDDSLAICTSILLQDVWVMGEHGNKKSWMKKLSILHRQLDLISILHFWPVHDTNQLVLFGHSRWGKLVALLAEGDGTTAVIETGGLPSIEGVPFQPTFVSLARN